VLVRHHPNIFFALFLVAVGEMVVRWSSMGAPFLFIFVAFRFPWFFLLGSPYVSSAICLSRCMISGDTDILGFPLRSKVIAVRVMVQLISSCLLSWPSSSDTP